jgi:hypothetical protein
MLPDRAGNVESWQFDRLLVILLRQFQRLFAQRGLELADADFQKVAAAVTSGDTSGSIVAALRAALPEIIAESEQVLYEMGLTFAQSLAVSMNDLPGWETTADFLQLANEKINAELRITAGASLLVSLGNTRYAQMLLDAIDHDLKTHGQLDVDAVIARRCLLFATSVSADDPDWLEKVRAWAGAG